LLRPYESTAIIHQITVITVISVTGLTAIIHQITVMPVMSVTGALRIGMCQW
jgi:hypothetical protein